jgi:TRAP-type C4-dicarboxylate transport system permease small subunit
MSDPEAVEPLPRNAFGRLIERLCVISALAGGAILVAVTLMSVASIIGRSMFSHPVEGDYELVQAGCAVFVACCLPYCQLKGGNIIVDFFTTRASPSTQLLLDAVGALLLGLVMALVTWRATVGLFAIRASGETGTILGLPTWYTYAGMVPGLALTAVVALCGALQQFRSARRWQQQVRAARR